MTYHNAVKYILNAPDQNGLSENSDRISAISKFLGSPERNIRYIRFAGSNGKSVCQAMLSAILSQSSLCTGSIIMPLSGEPRENILIDGAPISIEKIVEYTEAVATAVATLNKKIEDGDTAHLPQSIASGKINLTPTKNEVILLIALLAFKNAKCKISLIECDHNGTDPSKFLAPPICTVICGTIPNEDKQEIQKIKSYIRQGTSEIISAPQNTNAYKIISGACADINCRFSIPVRSSIQINHLSLRGSEFVYKDKAYRVSLCGKFQIYNACLVIEAVNMLNRLGMNISYEAICKGLSHIEIKSKFETLSILPTIIVDSTHKAEAVTTMIDTLSDFKEQTGSDTVLCISGSTTLVNTYLNSLSEKGYNVKEVIIPPCDETLDTEKLPKTVNINFCKNSKSAAKQIVEDAKSHGFVMITGNEKMANELRTEVLRILEY